MKLQKIILCVATALAAFGASLGLLEIGGYIRNTFQPVKKEIKPTKPVPSPTIVYPLNIPDFKQTDFTPPEVSNSEEDVCQWNETGDYYIIGENPKGFEDFENLSIITCVYNEKYPEGIAVKPQGSLEMKREFKFSLIYINGKRISFITQNRKGVSYHFDGKFVEKVRPTDEDTDYPELKGRLTKWQVGKKTAEAKVKFGIKCGC